MRRILPDLTPEGTALLARLPAEAASLRAAEMRVARTLAELVEKEPLRFGSAAAVGELGERHGLAAEQARALAGLGRAISDDVAVAALVRAGEIPAAAAALLGEVLASPGLRRPGDDWIRWAQTESVRDLRDRVMRRREEVLPDRRAVVPVRVYVTRQGRVEFDRARVVLSRKAQKTLTLGQTLECAVGHILDRYDPLRVTPGKRRLPDTRLVMVYGAGAVKGFRYVPAEVCREVRRRQGDRCAVAFCARRIFLQNAHAFVDHACGGDREADNLVLLCSYHHGLLDSGKLRMEGTAAMPRFFDELGRELSQRVAAPADAGDDFACAASSEPVSSNLALTKTAPSAPAQVEEVPAYVAWRGGSREVLSRGPAPP